MLYREIIAVRSEIHTNTLCGQNVELFNVKLVIRIVTTVNQERLNGHTARAEETKIAYYS